MAQLGATFDPNSVPPAEAMEVLPPGNYRAHIVNSDMRSTKDGNGQYLWLELAIIDGMYANRRVFDRLNLVNANQQAVEIAQRTLSAICHAVGQASVSDSEVLHHRPLTIKVSVRPAAGQYSAQNEVKSYMKDGPASPATAGTAPYTNGGGPAAHVAAAASKPNVPAWKRA
jgi:hypothetical protein